jgi:class 3 adenylate cyclase
MVPETRYARIGGRHVAYQVVGDGPVDVLVNSPVFSPIDLMWEDPNLARFLERLSSFSRSIWFDSWGTGASDPVPLIEASLVESVVDDMVGLLDAVGCERAAVLDLSGGWPAVLFAATHPERTRALVLDRPSARAREAGDYPEGFSDEQVDRRLSTFERMWGAGEALRFLAPTMVGESRFVRWFARCERLSFPPGELMSRYGPWYDTDMRQVLPAVKVPTLVLICPGHKITDQSRYVATHVDGARLVELPGSAMLYFVGDTRPMLDAIEEFLTGRVPDHDVDRVLATVVFTDVVGSTEHAARIGDRRWRELLATHDTLVRGELVRFRGREVKSMGDGFLATFDGPGRAVRCACAIRDAVSGLGVELRVGLHTGEIELQGDDVGGIAVHIAQRVMAEAQPGEVVASSTVRDLVAGSGIVFEDRGPRRLKGLSDEWRLYAAQV